MSKLILLSHVLPPSSSGQSIVLYRILSGINADRYCLVSQAAIAPGTEDDANMRLNLDAQHYSLPAEPAIRGSRKFGLWRAWKLINIIMLLFVRTRNLLKILRLELPAAMIVCTGDLYNIPAGFFASLLARTQFYVYLFDDFVFQWIGSERLFARLVSSIIFRLATGVIAPNEFVCQEYSRRYGINPVLIRNPCAENQLARRPSLPWPSESSKIKIMYTGALYYANYDSFRNLLHAIESLSEYRLELHVFTAQTFEEIASLGTRSEKIQLHSHVSNSDIIELQYQADILFLPLAFESPIPEVIRTSAPAKLGEYLASGRPVLAHVPADSFVAYYLDKNQCGLVSSKNNFEDLKEAILRLINDEGLRRTLTRNADQRARLDFDPQLARARFVEFLFSKNEENWS